jgi:hypothetical protein
VKSPPEHLPVSCADSDDQGSADKERESGTDSVVVLLGVLSNGLIVKRGIETMMSHRKTDSGSE